MTPELIVLLRSKPEEAVLAPCKGIDGTGPVQGVANCNTPAECEDCVVVANS